MRKKRIACQLSFLLIILIVATLPSGCGGGGGTTSSTSSSTPPPSDIGPNAVSNGSSLRGGTTHWISTCLGGSVFEIYTDQTLGALWNGPYIPPYVGSPPLALEGTWTATGDGTGLLMDWTEGVTQPSCPLADPKLQPHPVSLLNIQGSSSSGMFTADLVDSLGNNNQCTFSLAAGSIGGGGLSNVSCAQ